jgi:hypothetical protein
MRALSPDGETLKGGGEARGRRPEGQVNPYLCEGYATGAP